MTKRILAAVLAVILVVSAAAFAEDVKTIALGTSGYTLEVPVHFVNGEVTDQDMAESQLYYFRSDKTLLDFDVYQLSGTGTLAEFAAEDAKAFNGTDIITDGRIASYRARQESNGKTYDTLAYVFGEGSNFVRVVFWLDGDNAEAEAQAIINSLKK